MIYTFTVSYTIVHHYQPSLNRFMRRIENKYKILHDIKIEGKLPREVCAVIHPDIWMQAYR